MKHFLCISLLTLTTCIISTMDRSYLLPIEATLTQRLCAEGFSNFAQESQIAQILNNEDLELIIICGKISEILRKYNNSYPFIIAAWDHQSREPYPPQRPEQSQLMRIILQDYPNAIKTLEKNQFIESNKKTKKKYYCWKNNSLF